MTTASLSPDYLKSKRESKTYTFVEYLRKEAKSVDKHEFINGKIIKKSISNGPKNIINANVTSLIRNTENESVLRKPLIFSSKQIIFLPKLKDCIYADITGLLDTPKYFDKDQILLINPVFIIEIISGSRAIADIKSRIDKYKTLESFKEYVFIRQDTCNVEVWYREKPGLWHETIVTEPDGILPLQSVGISIEMREIYSGVEV